jgi:hypothetical protein
MIINMMKYSIKRAIKENKKEVIIIFLVIPLIISLCSFLPPSIRDKLKVNLSDFNVITFYTAIFIHDNLVHYLGNITVYIMYTFFAYSINLISQKRMWFLKNYLIFFLMLPLIMYTALISINRFYLGNRLHFSCGISGILSAIMGLLPMSFVLFLESSNIEARLNEIFFLIISVSLLFIPYIYEAKYFLFVIVLTVLFLVWRNRKGLETIGRFIKEILKQDIFSGMLIIMVIILYFFGITAIFPKTIILKGGIIDIFTHYVGWILGIFISYLLNVYEN